MKVRFHFVKVDVLSFQKPNNQDWRTLCFVLVQSFRMFRFYFVWNFWNVSNAREKHCSNFYSHGKSYCCQWISSWQSIRKIKVGNYLLAVDEYYLLSSIKLDCQDFYLAVNRYRLTANESYWLPMKIVDCKWKILAVNN